PHRKYCSRRDLLEKELKRLGVSIAFDEIASANSARTVDDLLAGIGIGEYTARQAIQRAASSQPESTDALAQIPEIAPPANPIEPSGIQVLGTGDVLTRLAKCCNPVVGEPSVGYVTRGRGVTIHRADCRNMLNEKDRDRVVEVNWGAPDAQGYPVPVRVESWDRVGLWRDVSAIVADAGINIEELHQVPITDPNRSVLLMRLRIHSLDQLAKILDKINRIPNVIDVRRETNGTN
ncbi:MAG: bifunctional (p)ppGpp synthetase/guanosine-3',5'-bis(diphosphate) 3'-pyrophosphohydrolase, partial [Chloroflexaceae bacterium]|nr:bifunctional (p)ppGpp synthetase/guanosine-3',5'-bis(diphosphate) 3'-pyrophosphohydrolase [Chloroflexaceae bacterium]